MIDLKYFNTLELAAYAVVNQLQEEPAFKWLDKDLLRWQDQIISKVKTRYCQKANKLGIRIPKAAIEVLDIEKAMGTKFWKIAIQKEMCNVRVYFEKGSRAVEYMRCGKVLPRYQDIGCHMKFNIKMDGNFSRGSCFVAGGHTTDPPASIIYSRVFSGDSVWIAFILAELNDLDVFAAIIGNAYLNDPCHEKICTKYGPEFGSHQGCIMLIVRVLYWLKSSGASWREMLTETLGKDGLSYTSAAADKDI